MLSSEEERRASQGDLAAPRRAAELGSGDKQFFPEPAGPGHSG